MKKRVFLIVLDSLGIGEAPDAEAFGDAGSNTLGSIRSSVRFRCPNLERLGLFNIDGVEGGVSNPEASYARMREASMGKDTTVGHWEIAGLISEEPLPTYPNGFPDEIIHEFERLTGRGVLCNRPYSGTAVIRDFGEEHLRTGKLIVYTSADSVFQIAAHEALIPTEELYRYCEIARRLLTGKHGVGRVIARPFAGEFPFVRTPQRHDYSLMPPQKTLIDLLLENGYQTIPVGKIYDIFAGRGLSTPMPTVSNEDGMKKTLQQAKQDFCGLCFVNLVDFDSVYGHRNDVDGYAAALSSFDAQLGELLDLMRPEDLLLITADHGCDPATPSTDHSREYTPLLLYGSCLKKGINLGTRPTFADIAATVLDYFDLPANALAGESLLPLVRKGERE